MGAIRFRVLVVALIVAVVSLSTPQTTDAGIRDFLVSLSTPQTTNAGIQDFSLLRTMCSETNFPEFCLESFSSDHRSAHADRTTLAKLAIQHALDRATSINEFVAQQSQAIVDPDTKVRYEECHARYDNAVKLLTSALEKFDAGKYEAVSPKLSGALANAGKCRKVFNKPPRDEQMELKCDEMGYLADISLVLVSLLEVD